jgi:hypothetical protein
MHRRFDGDKHAIFLLRGAEMARDLLAKAAAAFRDSRPGSRGQSCHPRQRIEVPVPKPGAALRPAKPAIDVKSWSVLRQ